MDIHPIVKRVKLPLRLSEELKREAGQRNCSPSQVVEQAIQKDLKSAAQSFAFGLFRPRVRRPRVAVQVENAASCALDPKAEVLAALLARRLRDRGFAGSGWADSRAAFRVAVAIHDLHCQLPRPPAENLARLRVNSTLCVAYRVTEAASGAEVAGHTLAISQVTRPIILGTAVGADCIHRLLDAAAEAIVDQFAALPLS